MPKGFIQFHQANVISKVSGELFPKYLQLFDVTLQTDASFTTHQYRAKFWGMLYIFSAHESHDAAARKMLLLLMMMMAMAVVVIVEMW